ncbi:Ferric iron ABC transporter, ATP-binding protein [Alkalibacterium sp. AK22]|uniref:ABC transporter ATP-binding protein n=1 Tax=Alkalibacterium sp. AK22 TaxID=1229520 RepID=UPI00044CD55A|nr:ABC transporter ATP-binding protein [Alkalibacterium sp. AK22]EXJ24094.1 Ferric iron ABC transporter, ATP-binding protein [Alkalibacterium sp. AK22]
MKVTFDEVTMTYGDRDVLDKISFDIPEGKLVSILGPSGCGKSTTLMLISGLAFPTEGDIYFGNEKVTKADAVKRKVGMVFQNYALYPHLTVLENIMFPLKMEKRPKKERMQRAKELAELVQIGDHIDKKPKQLSGGQQQRVAIARALAKEPSILLMDEPLSNLDARLRIEMREEIRRIQQETGVTTVFVTHDQEEALSISDEVMVLNGGSIQQYSDPITLYKRPVNKFVAEFLGTPVINTIDLRADSLLRDRLKLSQNGHSSATALGVRAEDIRQVHTADQALFTGTVSHVARIGKDTTVHVIDGDKECVATDLDIVPEEGETIHLSAHPDTVHYFDGEGQVIRVGAAV